MRWARRFPKLLCINVRNVDGLLADERFQGSKTADAKSRRRYYQEAIKAAKTSRWNSVTITCGFWPTVKFNSKFVAAARKISERKSLSWCSAPTN